VLTEFWWGNLRKRDHLEDLGTNGRIILEWIFKRWDWGMDWIALTQDGVRWTALANAVTNLQVS
jgi:hypothetical protein